MFRCSGLFYQNFTFDAILDNTTRQSAKGEIKLAKVEKPKKVKKVKEAVKKPVTKTVKKTTKKPVKKVVLKKK